MSQIKIRAIVLNSFDYNEKDKVVELFSLEKGRVTAILKGVRGPKAKLKAGSQPFCFGEFIIIEKEKGFDKIINIDIEESFYKLSKDIELYYSASTLLEITKKCLMEEEPNKLIFVNLLKALNEIAYKNVEANFILLKYISGILKVTGYRFNYKKCNICKQGLLSNFYFDLNENCFMCKSCKTNNSIKVEKQVIDLLIKIEKTDITSLKQLNDYNTDTIKQALKILVNQFEFSFNTKLKSTTIYKFN
ncbi:MAG: DNA repair protein RecO [Candidatus Woesearchaeota archaeon]